MKIMIEEVENGFTLEVLDEDIGRKLAFGGEDDPDILVEHGCAMLWAVVDLLELRGGRYDRKRVRVMTEMGDKYEPKAGEDLLIEEIITHVEDRK